MKKFIVFLMLVTMVAVPSLQAAVSTSDEAVLGDKRWSVQTDGDFVPGADDSYDIGSSSYRVDNVYVADLHVGSGSGIVQAVQFTPGEFIINSGSAVAEITTTTAPGLESDNSIVSLVWADGETTPASVTFSVPADYDSGGAFRVFCDNSADGATANKVDFNVYVNTSGSSFDAAASDQAPAALTKSAGTGEYVTLSVDTDFASLAANQVVTLNVWRDNVADGVDDLEIYYVDFYYSKDV